MGGEVALLRDSSVHLPAVLGEVGILPQAVAVEDGHFLERLNIYPETIITKHVKMLTSQCFVCLFWASVESSRRVCEEESF